MDSTHILSILAFEGYANPRKHWFICEIIWDTVHVTDKEKQMAQFIGGLRKTTLTWYINCKEK